MVSLPAPCTLLIINAVFAFLCGCCNKLARKLIKYVNTSSLLLHITSFICFKIKESLISTLCLIACSPANPLNVLYILLGVSCVGKKSMWSYVLLVGSLTFFNIF